jgi:hypothetical protein
MQQPLKELKWGFATAFRKTRTSKRRRRGVGGNVDGD